MLLLLSWVLLQLDIRYRLPSNSSPQCALVLESCEESVSCLEQYDKAKSRPYTAASVVVHFCFQHRVVLIYDAVHIICSSCSTHGSSKVTYLVASVNRSVKTASKVLRQTYSGRRGEKVTSNVLVAE